MMMFLAAEGGGSPVAVQLMPMISTVVVFIIALIVLGKFVWPKITAGLDERDRKIREEIARAEDSRKEAEAKQAEYESSLAEAREQMEQDRAKARADIQVYRDQLKSETDREVAELKQRALKEIESAKSAAVSELHTEATTLAAAIASKILQREISASDQQSLVDESLREMASVN